jgi:hypothetical protein
VGDATIASLALGKATVAKASLAGSGAPLKFKQTSAGLVVSVPGDPKSRMPYGLRIEGNMPLGV